MKTLTVRQPWASLIAVGAKQIETRSWPTRYRGHIAIHAGVNQRHIGIDFWNVHGKSATTISSALVQAGYVPTPGFPPFDQPQDDQLSPVPVGAIVATATLLDCVPVAWPTGPRQVTTYVADCEHEGDLPHQQGGLWLIGTNNLTGGRPTRIEDQRPFGDFSPGQFAWLLTGIEPLDQPIPAKGRQGLWEWTP